MIKRFQFAISVACLLWALGAQSTLAQTAAERSAQAPLVTAATSAESVRFTAPAKVYEMRLEVFAADGQTLYDSDFKLGKLLDWGLHDQQGQRLADGSYHCVVTTRSLYGRASSKQGTLLLQDGQPMLQTTQSPQDIQSRNLLASEPGDFLALPGKGAALSLTVLAHDGQQGRLMSGNGGLSFRTGDFFTGKDVEQMRLTADGKLGLGVTDPQAKLDVGGLIRTSEGIVFPDGSVQTTAYVASGRTIGERAGMQRDVQGRTVSDSQERKLDNRIEDGRRVTPRGPAATTGTAGHIAKFVDAVNLGDSSIIETFIGGINVATFGSATATGAAGNHVVEIIGSGPKTPLTLVGGSGSMEFWKDAVASKALAFGMARPGLGSSDDMVFSAYDGNAWAERMRLTNGGNLGIGTTSPGSKLTVNGEIHSTSGGIKFPDNTTQASAFNKAGDTMTGTLNLPSNGLVAGTNQLVLSNGRVGIGTTTPGYKLHVNAASNGTAITGETTGSNFAGVRGTATVDNFPAYGVYGQYASINDAAGYGVYGTTDSLNAYGVYGIAPKYGVYGLSNGSSGFGVYGKSTSGGTGVYGETTNGQGVKGVATATGGWAVYGLASQSAVVAGKFSGDVDVTGTLSKAGGSFKIDHPLDPENKFLSHSFVESPDMMNIYNGNVTTDSNGVAVVTLPDYLEALNRDFRYQLTVIGTFAQAIVAEKIKGNQFKIATSQPNVEVSWQVTGVRQDAWANKHRIPNEELKSETEKGYFLHPELFGKAEEKGLDWARHPEMMRQLKQQRAPAKNPVKQ